MRAEIAISAQSVLNGHRASYLCAEKVNMRRAGA